MKTWGPRIDGAFMKVVLRQVFLLGRFHATPWRAFPFEDPHGEWPPSPWRLLRAVLARSHQWERECGVDGSVWREQTVRALSTSKVSWNLPSFSWRGPGVGHYQPAAFGWDPPDWKKRKVPAEKRYRPTLTRDNFWIVSEPEAESKTGIVWWLLESTEWSRGLFDWLDASLARMTYFGRAESLTDVRRVERPPTNLEINCVLEDVPSSDSVPVLAPTPDATLDEVQAVTDDPAVAKSTTPPGARWRFCQTPGQTTGQAAAADTESESADTSHSVCDRNPRQRAAQINGRPHPTVSGTGHPRISWRRLAAGKRGPEGSGASADREGNGWNSAAGSSSPARPLRRFYSTERREKRRDCWFGVAIRLPRMNNGQFWTLPTESFRLRLAEHEEAIPGPYDSCPWIHRCRRRVGLTHKRIVDG